MGDLGRPPHDLEDAVLAELQGMAKSLEGLLSSAVDPALVRTTGAAGIVEAASAVEQRAAFLSIRRADFSRLKIWSKSPGGRIVTMF